MVGSQLGVPQGSVFGPLLFSVYIYIYLNDLQSVCDYVCIQMYADDTVIYMDGKDPEQVAAKSLMDKIANWLHESYLKLNVEYIFFFSK